VKLKLLILLSILVSLLIVIPSAFAVDDSINQTDSLSDIDNDKLGTNDYYFDASVSSDGNGLKDTPYKNIKSPRLLNNSNLYFANGIYSFRFDKEISDISFYGQNSSKTIINANGYKLTVSGLTNFKNITLKNVVLINKNNLTATNTIFSSSKGYKIDSYGNKGGAIYSNNASIILENCTFEDNAAEYGGAIFINEGNLKIINSIFSNNIAYNYGGAITALNSNVSVNNTRFINDKSSNDAGGAIYSKYSNLNIYNSNFTDLSADFGSAVTSLSSNTNLNNIIFDNNTAKFEGGALYLMYGSLSLTNSKFYNNSANNGGALFVDSMDFFNIDSNYFVNNHANYFAGALYSVFNSVSIGINTFENNSAKYFNDKYESSSFDFIGNRNYTLYSNNITFDGEIPYYYSLVDDNFITSVKNQQNGGNCWAFSAITTLESCILKAGGPVLDLSEENMKNIMALFSDYGWDNEPNEGGNFYMATAYLASWLGPVLDSYDLYDGESDLSTVFNSLMHVQNALFLKRNNFTDNDEIKKAILKYGAVTSSMFYNDYFLLDDFKYYNPFSFSSNHAVTIIGWDDNMEISGHTGAWIVRNSWGPKWGDNGNFYVSYYDATLMEIGELDGCTFILNDTIHYDKNYQYDIEGCTFAISYSSPSGAKVNKYYKNIFTATEDEYLTAVSTYFLGNYDWTVNVKVNGVLKVSKSGFSNPGYYTIDLGKLIPLLKDDEFEVEFKISALGDVTIPFCSFNTANRISSTPGVSFLKNGSGYQDLYSTNKVACIKAFTTYGIDTKTDLDIIYSDIFNITARVSDIYGNKLNTGNITFNINGVLKSYPVINGVAYITDLLNSEENYISAQFNAEGYISSSNFTSFKRTVIDADDLNTIYGNGDSFNVHLSDLYGDSVSNRLVKFILNKITYERNTDSNGIATLPVNIDAGDYDIIIQYAGYNSQNTNYSITKKVNIAKKEINLTLSVKQDKDDAVVVINAGEGVNEAIFVYINQDDHDYVLINGLKEINLNDLDYGKYTIEVIGKKNYLFLNNTLTFDVSVKRTKLSADRLITFYGSGALFTVQLKDVYGQLINGKKIVLSINGDKIINTTDSLGIASFAINLNANSYNLNASFSGDDDYIESTISSNVLIKSTVMFYNSTYTHNSNYCVSFLDSEGNPLANKNVKITIGKVFDIKTDENGFAYVNLTVDSGNYVAEIFNPETGETAYQNIQVLEDIKPPVDPGKSGDDNSSGDSGNTPSIDPSHDSGKMQLKAKNIKVKRGKKIKFKATLLDANSHPINGVKVTMKFKGKKYKVKTKKGVATLKLKLKLKKGKYKIITQYSNLKIKNTIQIK